MKEDMKISRHNQILAQLSVKGSMSWKELQKQFDVTAMTLWRDLKFLEEQGLLRRVHGGIVLPIHQVPDDSFESRTQKIDPIKKQIAAAAAELIHPGNVLFLEGGSTVAAIVDFLPETQVTVLTNSLPVALLVRAKKPKLLIEVAGGWLSPTTGNTTGPDVLRWVAKKKIDIAFIGATAFDSELGPMDMNPAEIEIKRAFCYGARQKVMLMGSQKFGKKSAAVTIHMKWIDLLYTDQMLPLIYQSFLKRNGVVLKIAQK